MGAAEEGPPRKRSRTAESGEEGRRDAEPAGSPLGFALEPDEYAVSLDMTGKAGGLGLDVDWADGKTLFIKAVKKEGAIATWNRGRPSVETVEAGDCIVSINGKIYDTEAMLAEVKGKKQLNMVIRTPREPPPKGDAWTGRRREYSVEVDLDKKPGLGLDVDWADGKTLFIKAVKPEGAIPDFNKRCPEREALRAGDRITAINGKAGDPKAMLAEVKKKGKLELLIQTEEPKQERPAAEALRASPPAPAEPRPQAAPLKAHEFVVWADLGKWTVLGLEVSWEDGKTLFVNEVRGGAVQDWNSAHQAHQQVASGDRVIAVNGFYGNGERMAELCRDLCSAQGKVLLHIRGPPPPPPEARRKAGKEGAASDEDREQKKEKRDKKEKKAKEDKEEKAAKEKEKVGKKEEKRDKKEKKDR